MIDFECELWQQTPVNETLLRLYVEYDRQSRAETPDYDGWFGRIDDHPDLSAEELTKGHGNLIALGFLKVDIGGRSGGAKYQVTSAGKRQLDAALILMGDDETDDGESNSVDSANEAA